MRTRRFTARITAGRETPVEVTADFVYIRLHGPGGADQGSYDDAALATWTERLHDWSRRGLNVYCYFDTTRTAMRRQNALRLKQLLEPT